MAQGSIPWTAVGLLVSIFVVVRMVLDSKETNAMTISRVLNQTVEALVETVWQIDVSLVAGLLPPLL